MSRSGLLKIHLTEAIINALKITLRYYSFVNVAKVFLSYPLQRDYSGARKHEHKRQCY